MGAGTTANATVGVEPMGSHLVVTTVPGHDLAGALTALPHVLRDPTREPHRWSVPAVPVVARAVRSLVALQPDVLLEPAAEALLIAVEALPETATAVAHFCEHKPGVPGVVIAMEPDPDLRAAFAQLPQRRHDRARRAAGGARRRARPPRRASARWCAPPPTARSPKATASWPSCWTGSRRTPHSWSGRASSRRQIRGALGNAAFRRPHEIARRSGNGTWAAAERRRLCPWTSRCPLREVGATPFGNELSPSSCATDHGPLELDAIQALTLEWPDGSVLVTAG